MSRREKLLKRLMKKPKDFTYEEARTLLIRLRFRGRSERKNIGFTSYF